MRTQPVAWIYARVCTEDQAREDTSLDTQVAACVAEAERQGYHIGASCESSSRALSYSTGRCSANRVRHKAGRFLGRSDLPVTIPSCTSRLPH